MALNIVKSSTALTVNKVNILIYGQPGAGKTSVAFTSKRPLLLDFDGGSHRSAFRKDIVLIENWEEVSRLTKEDLADYDTLIVDTVGRLLDFLTDSLIRSDAKLGTRNGGLTLQGWGALKSTFSGWLKSVNLLGKDVILIAHDKEDKEGDLKFVRPDISGGSYNEVSKTVDFVGYVFMENKKRVIDFNPCEKYIGKNSADIELQYIPDFKLKPAYFEEIISSMKDKLNSFVAQQKEAVTTITELTNELNQIDNASKLNEFIVKIQNADYGKSVIATIRNAVKNKVEELKLFYDKEQKLYFDTEPVISNSETVEETQVPVMETEETATNENELVPVGEDEFKF